ncbi:hypothetical protein LL962_16940 [Xanthomonas sp. NCPPB 1067]|uniref:hypothetical protein n=1 Tax=Xanthomonas TaxID=338 RepID=UPI0011B069DE|nr:MULTISPECIES: hypothetical protein [Xanthomonas]MCC4588767.1 hypothetical protein [Xanthomonas sp. NCPPB 1067]
MASFPPNIRLLAGDLGEEPEPSVQRTEMERGPAKQAIINTRVMVELPITMVFLTAESMVAFDDFYFDEIGRVGYFDMVHPRTRKLVSARFKGGAVGRLQAANAEFTQGTRQAVLEFRR